MYKGILRFFKWGLGKGVLRVTRLVHRPVCILFFLLNDDALPPPPISCGFEPTVDKGVPSPPFHRLPCAPTTTPPSWSKNRQKKSCGPSTRWLLDTRGANHHHQGGGGVGGQNITFWLMTGRWG